MQLITAIIRPEKLDVVRQALADAGVHGLTVSEAAGFGRQRGHVEVYRGAGYAVDLVQKVRLDIAAHDVDARNIVEVIVASACTGNPGDGKVWTTQVQEVYRVSTGETGESAI